MPKVDTIYFKLEGELVEIRAMFNTKNNFYVTEDEWPEVISTVTNTRKPSGFLTLQELKNYVREIVQKYHKEIEQITKVIRYRISSGMSFHWKRNSVRGASKSHGKYSWMGTIGNRGDTDYGEVGLAISFMICFKKVSDKTEYQEIVEQDGEIHYGGWFEPKKYSSMDDEYREMEYTEQRHTFFLEAQDKINALTKMVGDFFEPSNNVIEKIDAQQKLISIQ